MKTPLKSISLVLAGALAGFIIASAIPSTHNVSLAHSRKADMQLGATIGRMKADIAKLRESIQLTATKVENNRKRIASTYAKTRANKFFIDKWKKLPLH